MPIIWHWSSASTQDGGRKREASHISVEDPCSSWKEYSQIEKEGRAIVFTIQNFDHYLRDRTFTIYLDHQPLKFLFNESRPVLQMASLRIQHWALMLGAYKYTTWHQPGSQMSNADALSRLPLAEMELHVPIPGDIHHLFDQLSSSIITASHIRNWTGKDPVLSRVWHFVQSGWDTHSPGPEFQPYFNWRMELTVVDNCSLCLISTYCLFCSVISALHWQRLIWLVKTQVPCILVGAWVIISPTGCDIILEQLHDIHPGINKMKALARLYVWWPGLDTAITAKVQSCQICQESCPNLEKAPLHPWECWAKSPLGKITFGPCRPFFRKLYLVVMDTHSKWIDALIVKSTSAEATISKLLTLFITHGLLSRLWWTTQLDSGVRSLRNSPVSITLSTSTLLYHPSSNGLGEHAVQTVKAKSTLPSLHSLHWGSRQLSCCLEGSPTPIWIFYTQTCLGRSQLHNGRESPAGVNSLVDKSMPCYSMGLCINCLVQNWSYSSLFRRRIEYKSYKS